MTNLSHSEMWGQPPNWEPRTAAQRAQDNVMCGHCGHPRQRHAAGACNYMAGFRHPCQCQRFVEDDDLACQKFQRERTNRGQSET